MWRQIWTGMIDIAVMGLFVGLCAGLTLALGV
jgi:hypothetical protein